MRFPLVPVVNAVLNYLIFDNKPKHIIPMSYDVQLFRTETKTKHEESADENFFEKKENLVPFTPEQKNELHERLLQYDYVVNGEGSYGHPDLKSVSVLLTDRAVYFSAGGDDIFDISMTASEFTDSGHFVKYDPQDMGWEEIED